MLKWPKNFVVFISIRFKLIQDKIIIKVKIYHDNRFKLVFIFDQIYLSLKANLGDKINDASKLRAKFLVIKTRISNNFQFDIGLK